MKGYLHEMFQVITGYIYFIQMDCIGPIKIGFTKDIKKRMVHLQQANPYKLNLLVLFPGNEEMEKAIHEGFREANLKGEWFLPHPEILKEIEERKKWNRINRFYKSCPENDIGDFTFGGGGWEKPYWKERCTEYQNKILGED